MADRATALFYAARPALAVGGVQDPALVEGLLALMVEETTAGLYRCEATFGNWGASGGEVGYLYFDRRLLDFGKSFTVEIGAGEAAAQIFDGKITALEGRFPQDRPPEIVVLAEDRFQDLRMIRRSRSFEDTSDREVMERIASEHGLSADIDVDGPAYRVLAQVNQSDLAFLRERARAADAEVWIEGATLHAQARSRRRMAEVTLTYGRSLFEFSVTADLAEQRTSLTVSGWDVAAKQSIEEEAAEAAIQGELNGGRSGRALLEESLGRRPERVVHLMPLTNQEARALAEAHFRRTARRFVRGRAVAEGDGRLRAGTHVTLRGLGPMFDGAYYVTEVKHAFDPVHGYRTHFSVERPWIGGD